jgi:hypothetical protein
VKAEVADESSPAPVMIAVEDFARDSLHLLPLDMIPLHTPGLRRAKLIKNSRLRTVVELFRDRASGSGQIEINDLPKAFPSDPDGMADDLRVLDKLATLQSFDVYSLRIELRNLSIPVDEDVKLSLSAAKRAELTEAMRSFTRPLLEFVYGRADQRIADVSDILQMLSSPNQAEALKNLHTLASRLRISLHDLPTFLEDYGDIFLSLAYFRQCLDHVVPDVHDFLVWLTAIRQMDQISRDKPMQQLLDGVSADLTVITSSVTGRFESFDRRSQDFWSDINAASFREITRLITTHHTTLGSVMCGLTVKMDLWKERFPTGGGGPLRRIEFVTSELLPGLDQIRDLEQAAAKM